MSAQKGNKGKGGNGGRRKGGKGGKKIVCDINKQNIASQNERVRWRLKGCEEINSMLVKQDQ